MLISRPGARIPQAVGGKGAEFLKSTKSLFKGKNCRQTRFLRVRLQSKVPNVFTLLPISQRTGFHGFTELFR